MPRPLSLPAWIVVAGFFFALASPRAEVLVLQQGRDAYAGCGDNSIYSDYPINTNGGHPFLYSGNTKLGSARRALIRFSLPDLPPGALIQSVELRMTVNRAADNATNEETHKLHRIRAPWGEGSVDSLLIGSDGGSGAPATEGDATWLSNFYTLSDWPAPGGDFEPAISGAGLVGGVTGIPPNTIEDEALFTGAGLAADVQSWLANPSQNHGWIIIGNEAANKSARRLYSSEWEEPDPESQSRRRPELTIIYESPNAVSQWTLYD